MASLQAERACLAAEEWIRTFGLAFILLQSPFPELWMLLQICRDPCGPALVPQTYLCLQRTDSSEFRAKAMCTCPGTLSVMPCLCAAQVVLEVAPMSCKREPHRWRRAVLAAVGNRHAAVSEVFVNKLLCGSGGIIAGFGLGCLPQ